MRTKVAKETKTETTAQVAVPALALSVEDAARALSIGRTMVFYLIRDGRLRSVKIGSRTVVPVWAIEEFLSAPQAA